VAFSQKQILDNHAKLLARNAVYKHFGYDVTASIGFILSHIGSIRGRVLEIGTGKGRFTVALAALADHITTVDIDSSEQRYAKLNVAYQKQTGTIRYRQQDARALTWKRPTFDVVVSMNTLHHIPDVPRAIKEILRVAHADGKIILSDFNEAGFRIMDRIHKSEGHTHDRLSFDWDEIADLFSKAGWRPQCFEGHHQQLLLAMRPNSG
jgi:ubiquinone/menaquinone biosynthesis C-methylase UbiE